VTERDVPVVLTDRLAAVGWHLAGARVAVVGPGEAPAAFEQALATTRLVLLTVAVATALPPAALAAARRGATPLVLVLDEALEAAASRPVARYARGVLGVEP
jgi:vacuolar-type H+-ATPase subunit F/Vma7